MCGLVNDLDGLAGMDNGVVPEAVPALDVVDLDLVFAGYGPQRVTPLNDVLYRAAAGRGLRRAVEYSNGFSGPESAGVGNVVPALKIPHRYVIAARDHGQALTRPDTVADALGCDQARLQGLQLERRLRIEWIHQQLLIPGQAQFLAYPDQVAINVIAGAQHGHRHVMAGGNF